MNKPVFPKVFIIMNNYSKLFPIRSVNRIGSLRSQTQYSDISSEKRSPRPTVRLSIKQSNGGTMQANNLQITLNGLGRTKSYGQNGKTRSRSLNQSNKTGPTLKVERTKSAQPNEANGTNKKRNENKDNALDTVTVIRDEDRIKVDANDRPGDDQRSTRSGETENDQDSSNRCKTQLSKPLNGNEMKWPNQSKQQEFPKLEKLIHREMKMLSEKQFSSKLIRCKTAVEIDDYVSDSKGRSKVARKLIFSETIG